MTRSRLLRDLERRIAASRSRLEADCLRAERAAYLARQGEGGQVDAILVELRRRYDPRPEPAVAVWINLSEGLTSHFADMGPRAADKIRRAHAMSALTRLPQLRALTAAWSAHMAYLDASFETMAALLHQALDLAAPDNHGARSRTCLVAGQALHFAGRPDLAQPWYTATRRHALDEGDDATLSALLHNSAWLRAVALRADVLLAGIPVENEAHALMSADSTLHYDRFTGAGSLPALTPMLRALVLSVLGRPAEAVVLYDRCLAASIAQGVGRTIAADLIADRAWCHAVLGDAKLAQRHAEAALARINPDGHCVDRMVAHKRLAQVFGALGDAPRAAGQDALAAAAWNGHRAEQARVLKLLPPSLAARVAVGR